jgi:tRNA(fMet)-specific endonuclease VapC
VNAVIDTSRYRDFCNNDPVAVEHVRTAENLYLPFVSLAELRSGFLFGTQTRQNEQILNRFLNSPRVSVLYPTTQTIRNFSQIFYQLRQQGTPIPTNDMWIAALVVEHDLMLFSRDPHFIHLPQIPRVR